MRGKTVIAASGGFYVFPKRARSICHVKERGNRFIENLLPQPNARQEFQSHHIPDERVGLMDFGKSARVLAPRPEMISRVFPQRRMAFWRHDAEVKR